MRGTVAGSMNEPLQDHTMRQELDFDALGDLRRSLDDHPIYGAVRTLEDLRVFMQHHVFSVWDFMSLLKELQRVVAPPRVPWTPPAGGNIVRFINELVLEEESDRATPEETDSPRFASHFELYCEAMREIGADTSVVETFVETLSQRGLEEALNLPEVPRASAHFMRQTFDFVEQGKPHITAAALALGREQIIPSMFRALLDSMRIGRTEAPLFHYYLERHIHLDDGFHAPMSLRLMSELCGDDAARIDETQAAAREALQARIGFWNGVLDTLPSRSCVGGVKDPKNAAA